MEMLQSVNAWCAITIIIILIFAALIYLRPHWAKSSLSIIWGVLFCITIVFLVLKIPEEVKRGNLLKWIEMVLDDRWSDILSISLSFIALMIAHVTYSKIDKVRDVTSMEANVLENPNYTAPYDGMICEIRECCNTNVDYIKYYNKKFLARRLYWTDTCIETADRVQQLIDGIYLNAYCARMLEIDDSSTNEVCGELIKNYKRIKKINTRLEKQKAKFQKMSSHIQYVTGENIKLIQYILDYQLNNYRQRNGIEEEFGHYSIRDICGTMIINPIAQLNYYNYFGLFCFNEARKIVKLCVGEREKIDTIELEYKTVWIQDLIDMKDIFVDRWNEEKIIKVEGVEVKTTKREIKKIIERLCEEAIKQFVNAEKVCQRIDDRIWKGYVSYNLARVYMFQYILEMVLGNGIEEEKSLSYENALKYVNRTCDIRKNIWQVLIGKKGYLGKCFEYEYIEALKLKADFKKICSYLKKDNNEGE